MKGVNRPNGNFIRIQFWVFLLVGICSCVTSATAQDQKQSTTETILGALQKLQTGTEEEQDSAAPQLWETIRGYGMGDLAPKDIVPIIAKTATQSPYGHVREFAIAALGEIKNEIVVPTLIQGLSDKWKPVVDNACQGLRNLGSKAEAAIPALNQGLLSGTFPDNAIYALVAIQGKGATPIILQAVERKHGYAEFYSSAAHAFLESADWRAADFMASGVTEHTVSTSLVAAYFAKFNNDFSTKQLRLLLDLVTTKDTGTSNSAQKQLDMGAETRFNCVEGLGLRKDQISYDKIRHLLRSDTN